MSADRGNNPVKSIFDFVTNTVQRTTDEERISGLIQQGQKLSNSDKLRWLQIKDPKLYNKIKLQDKLNLNNNKPKQLVQTKARIIDKFGVDITDKNRTEYQSTLVGTGDRAEYYKHPEEIRDYSTPENINNFNGFVPLPYKYLGPGNSLTRGEPYNQIDAHAKEHDIAYDSAKTQEDIRRADIKLLGEASNHIVEGISGRGSISDTVGSALAGLGIGAKYLLEKQTGVLYPKNLPNETTTQSSSTQQSSTPMDVDNNRRRRPSLSLGPPAQRRRENEPDQSNQPPEAGEVHDVNNAPQPEPNQIQAEMALTGTGKEQASGGASSDGQRKYAIEKPISLFDAKINVYKKSHKFMTFGIASVIISPPPVTNPYTFLTTYLAEVPWHIPALYLNQSEYDLLSDGAHVLEVSVEVYYRGSTIQFKTAETTSTLATLNQINDIGVAHGLNRSGQGSNVNYATFGTGETAMVPLSVIQPIYGPVNNYRGMVRDYYGANQTDITNFTADVPKHQVGRQTFLYNYWALSLTGNATPALPNNLQTGGWPLLTDKIQQMDGKTVVNTCVAKSTYKPKQAPLKQPLRTIGHGLPNPALGTTISVPNNGRLINSQNAQITTPVIPDSAGQKLNVVSLNTGFSNDPAADPNFDIYMPIEKSQITRTGYWGQADCHIQPSLHIGVQPVPALSTISMIPAPTQFNNWTDTRAYWEVVATMVVKEQTPTAYPYAAAGNVPHGENVVFVPASQTPAVQTNPRLDGATFAGLYTTTHPGLPTV